MEHVPLGEGSITLFLLRKWIGDRTPSPGTSFNSLVFSNILAAPLIQYRVPLSSFLSAVSSPKYDPHNPQWTAVIGKYSLPFSYF